MNAVRWRSMWSSMIRVHILCSGGVIYSVKLPNSRPHSIRTAESASDLSEELRIPSFRQRQYGPVGSFCFFFFLTTATILTCAEVMCHFIPSCRYNPQGENTSSNSGHLPYYPALAFTQYDPFGHSYSAMLDLCISMLLGRAWL